MIGELREFTSKDGLKIKYIAYRVNEPKASIIHIHGIAGSPFIDLEELGRYLNTKSINLYRIYLRGFPPSEGVKGDIDSFETFYRDIAQLYDIIEDEDRSPIFISGRSLGGALAAHFTSKEIRDIRGTILINPAYKTGGRFKLPLTTTLKVLLGYIFTPHKVFINTYRDPRWITHPEDRREAEERQGDPNIIYVYSPKFLMEAYRASRQMPKVAMKACKPLLLIY